MILCLVGYKALHSGKDACLLPQTAALCGTSLEGELLDEHVNDKKSQHRGTSRCACKNCISRKATAVKVILTCGDSVTAGSFRKLPRPGSARATSIHQTIEGVTMRTEQREGDREADRNKWAEDTLRKIAADKKIDVKPSDIVSVAQAVTEALRDSTAR